MAVFQYDAEIMSRFPKTVGGVIVGNDVTNPPTSTQLAELYQKEQETVIQRIGDTTLSELPTLSAWRSVLRGFGVDATKYRSAPEALLRRLTKKGDIPCINTLVDIGNIISIRYGVPVAVFDLQRVQGTITVHFADGSEHYQELGNDEVIHPDVGEVVFSDETGMVIARRWCWRQSETGAAIESTQNILVTIEAQHEGGLEDATKAVGEMLDLLQQFSGGVYRHAILNGDKLSI